MMYDAPPPIAEPPRCQAQCMEEGSESRGATYHACIKGQHMPHYHVCKCGYGWL